MPIMTSEPLFDGYTLNESLLTSRKASNSLREILISFPARSVIAFSAASIFMGEDLRASVSFARKAAGSIMTTGGVEGVGDSGGSGLTGIAGFAGCEAALKSPWTRSMVQINFAASARVAVLFPE